MLITLKHLPGEGLLTSLRTVNHMFYADIKVIPGVGHGFHAHKLFLGSISSFLNSIVDGIPSDHGISVIIPDTREDILKCFITLCYTGSIVCNPKQYEDLMTLLELLRVDNIDTIETEAREVVARQIKRPAPKGTMSEIICLDDDEKPSPSKTTKLSAVQVQTPPKAIVSPQPKVGNNVRPIMSPRATNTGSATVRPLHKQYPSCSITRVSLPETKPQTPLQSLVSKQTGSSTITNKGMPKLTPYSPKEKVSVASLDCKVDCSDDIIEIEDDPPPSDKPVQKRVSDAMMQTDTIEPPQEEHGFSEFLIMDVRSISEDQHSQVHEYPSEQNLNPEGPSEDLAASLLLSNALPFMNRSVTDLLTRKSNVPYSQLLANGIMSSANASATVSLSSVLPSHASLCCSSTQSVGMEQSDVNGQSNIMVQESTDRGETTIVGDDQTFEMSFSCNECNLHYSTFDQRLSHMRKMHSTTVKTKRTPAVVTNQTQSGDISDSDIAVIRCVDNRKAPQQRKRPTAESRQGKGGKRLSCDLCSKTFTSDKSLTAHLVEHANRMSS